MCGITGIYDIQSKYAVEKEVLSAMAESIEHRGPDESSCFIDKNIGFGFQRLSIIDVSHGHQPYFNDDASVRMICNGEIYNYKALRKELQDKGYQFRTNCDVEVILHLYLEYGKSFISRLNGQFAFAISDSRSQSLLLARDQFGICPLFYTEIDDIFIFGSEIKSILKHPAVKRSVNLTGLDQILSFPGLVSPSTMFENIHSLKPGHLIEIKDGRIKEEEYWDLVYPPADYPYENKPESYYIEKLDELLTRSVDLRLNADVPVGFYLSGGLDSSLIGALMKKIKPETRYQSFSIGFPELENKDIDERQYQRMMARHINSLHNEIPFDYQEIEQRLTSAVYFSECPLKETYNTCSLALSEAVYKSGIKVILSGEGADELMGGYVGYRFDKQRAQQPPSTDLEEILEDQTREKLWGDSRFFYEKNQNEFSETKQALYSDLVNSQYSRFNSIDNLQIDKSKLQGRDVFHKRAYLDLKLRLSDHLISDHCDRVAYANSIEGRYPFLDIELVEFIKTIPPDMKLNNLVEKYLLKKMAVNYLPDKIFNRQKQGFVAPGSSYLIKKNIPWINDMLSYDRIKRQGYFNPDTIERLKKIYSKDDFKLNLPFDSDLLITVLTFNIFLDSFSMPDL